MRSQENHLFLSTQEKKYINSSFNSSDLLSVDNFLLTPNLINSSGIVDKSINSKLFASDISLSLAKQDR